MDLAAAAFRLSVSTDLLRIYDGGGAALRRMARGVDGSQTLSSLPPVSPGGIRPGAMSRMTFWLENHG